jgi:hypothetical protein
MRNIFFLVLLVFIQSCQKKLDECELNFIPYSTSTIHLFAKESLNDTIEAKAYAFTIIPYGESRSESLRIANRGNYFLSMNIDRPTKSFLTVGDKEYCIIVFPNDTSHIDLNKAPSNIDVNFQEEEAPSIDIL